MSVCRSLDCHVDLDSLSMVHWEDAGGTYTRGRPPECGLETVDQMPPFQYCRVVEVPSDTVAQVRGCTRMRGARKTHSPDA